MGLRWLYAAAVLACAVQCALGLVCYGDKSHPCYCDLESEDLTLDLSYIENGVFSVISEEFYFQFHPCYSFHCGPGKHDVIVCMYNTETKEYYVLGRMTSSKHGNPWTISSFSPLNFTIQYNDGDVVDSTTLYSTIRVVYMENIIESKFTFEGSTLHNGNKSENFKFLLLAPVWKWGNNTHHTQKNLAEPVIGGWLFLVLVVVYIVTIAVFVYITRYKKKHKKYRQLTHPILTAFLMLIYISLLLLIYYVKLLL